MDLSAIWPAIGVMVAVAVPFAGLIMQLTVRMAVLEQRLSQIEQEMDVLTFRQSPTTSRTNRRMK